MECAARGRGEPCAPGPPTRRCGLCGAVAYCSPSHQALHWNEHKEECARLEEHMKHADLLNDFPFTFSMEATRSVTRCSFLMSKGLHQIGLWKSECSCKPTVVSTNYSWMVDDWKLPSSLCPCTATYHIPLLSTLSYSKFNFGSWQQIVHTLFRDGMTFELCKYVNCSEESCPCRSSCIDSGTGGSNGQTSKVTLKLHKGFYHDRYIDIIKDSYPQLIVAPNAGVAAYANWLPTIKLIKEMGVPAVFSDFCEEAAYLGARCISTTTCQPLKLPIQINPFRQPMEVVDSALYLPCYSNCFLFGI
uniref:Uncharacterized protein LOC105042930 isoform X2 n=1 Tax=Elaeis guineensis var. tenera TaxID=51953 RepID=A0A6J0PHF7_ELAGV|nr:uncharacterized protein LOC105042930 isoform X2 [Elaeis guineensis]